MDFTLPRALEEVRLRTRAFVADHILPLEAQADAYDDHENIRLDLLAQVREKAKAAGLWAPQSARELGGMDLPIIGWAAMYEEANRSIFGPAVFNCAAPDDGNMRVLRKVATPAQQERWLKPIVEGRVRSSSSASTTVRPMERGRSPSARKMSKVMLVTHIIGPSSRDSISPMDTM